MPDPQLTPAQFAASIKEKYPQYKAVPDEQLARAMVDKYPQYAKQVTFEPSKQGEKREAAPANPGSSLPQLRGPAKGWKAKAYTAADRLLPMLPAAGMTIGGLAAGAGGAVGGPLDLLVAPTGAAEGGAIGEATRSVLSRAIFPKETNPERNADEADPVQEAKRLITQTGMGFFSELGARGLTGIGKRIAAPFEASAATVKAAKAGDGVRMTPGEAGNSPSLSRIEKVLGHLPGGSGPIEGFREAQSHDALAMMDKQLDSLSTNRLSDEETGKAVQKIVADSRKALTTQESTKYDEVKRLLGVDPKTFMTPEQIDSAVEKKIDFYKQMGGGTPDVVGKLQAARNFTRTSRADVETKVMDRLMRKEPELMGDYLRKSSLANLREFNKLMPGPVRQQAAANVLQNIITQATDAQTKQINQRVFAGALKDLGEGRGRLIFGAQYPAIREGSELLNRIAPMAGSGGAMSAMHTVRQLIEVGSVAAAAIGFSGHAYSAAAAVGGPVLAMRFIATALTHPQASAAVLKALRMTAAGTFRSVPYAVNAIAAPNYKDTYLQAPTQ
jgi:hypothetical protein